MNPFLLFFASGLVWSLVVLITALPWVVALDPRGFRTALRRPATWGIALAVWVGLAFVLAIFVRLVGDPVKLAVWGKAFGGLIELQLIIDIFVVIFPLLTLVWPQGAAVALAAFREGVRQPMFWLIIGFAGGLMMFSPFLPYFTFGEDFKMVHELGYDITMLAGVLFTVLAASLSISEEIEGRTAITVMSKPVSRRQFLVGKYVGILLAGLFMVALLGCLFNGVMWFEYWFDNQDIANPVWSDLVRANLSEKLGEAPLSFSVGALIWFEYAFIQLPGLVFAACQSMVLLAIAVALATRLPFIVTFVTCGVVFFLGHLTHVLVQVSAQRYTLVNFMAKFFDNVLPGLEYFDPGVLLRDIMPDKSLLWTYVGTVWLYATLYSIIALLFGLILFEDRDLA
ncbi:MAG TPA: ABC transporter permease subunit [Gemmataceae bacterium]|jgi:ABC-type transport system involved in multi-copper enzyme maturation permease subunit|nr:ABC transporter permease subunit [Gemmataceae bacterium]